MHQKRVFNLNGFFVPINMEKRNHNPDILLNNYEHITYINKKSVIL